MVPAGKTVEQKVSAFLGQTGAWFYQNRWVLLIVMAAAMILYYPVYAFGLENLDSFCTSEPYVADLWEQIPYWETQQGRWALRLFDGLTDGVHAAVPAAFATAFFFAWAGVLLCDLLQIRHFALRTASVLLLVCSQYVQNLQSYRYCKAAYAFSFLLAVLAVVAVVKLPGIRGILLGAVSLMFAVALYQSSLGVGAALCVLVLIRRLLRPGEPLQESLLCLGRMLLMGILAMAGYLVVLNVLLAVYQVSLSEINGISQVGVQSLQQIPLGIRQAYQDFYEYFAGRTIAQNYFKIRPAYGLLFALTAAGGVWAVWKNRACRAANICVVILLALLPLAANITDVINPNSQILLRMAGGMALIPIFCLALAGMLPGRSVTYSAVVLAALFLLRGYILQSNNDIIVQKEDKLQALSIAEQIADDVLDHEEYQNGMPVVILGRPSDSTYGLPAAQNRDKANPLIQWGIFWLDTQQNMDTWARLFQEDLGLTMHWCDYETAKEIHGSSAYQEMPLYPNLGSVAVLDETLVVKVS